MTKNDNPAIWPYGHGWKWTAKSIDGRGETWRTDKTGCGLFRLRIDSAGGERWEQTRGTAQYSLPSDRNRAIALLRQRGRNYPGSAIVTISELSALRGDF